MGRIDDDDRAGWDTGSQDASSVDDADGGWRRAVLDVSALMWAPKRVRAMVGLGWEIVVPLEALSTLDILKKGDSQAAIAARGAARYIEHATRHFSPDSTHARARGLRIQADAERVALDADGALPRWLAHVLSCAAYFGRSDDGDDGATVAALYIAHPPLLAEVEATALDDDEREAAYVERAEGYRVSREAERFELALEVLRDEEDERPRRRKRGGGPGGERGRGRGGGRGRHEHDDSWRGHGRDREARDEPREVKILLRRPDAEPEPKSPADAAPPTLPRTEYPTRVSKYEPAVPRPPSASGSSRGDRGGRGGRGRGRGRGQGHGGRGRGRERNVESGFTLLTRPGPPLATHVDSVPAGARHDVSPRLLTRDVPPASKQAERSVTLLARPAPPVERSLVRPRSPGRASQAVPPSSAHMPRLPQTSFHPDFPLGPSVCPPAFRPTFRPPPSHRPSVHADRVFLLERPK
ncbi:hypothetical protein Q5752_006762 [Cryptotrichosporon argae]